MSAVERVDVLTQSEVDASFIPTANRDIVSCMICACLVDYNLRCDHILKAHGGMPFERFL